MGKSKHLRVKLIRSISGRIKSHQSCVRGLGLRKINDIVEVENTDANRGMVNKVSYLLKFEEI